MIYPYRENQPRLGQGVFVADNASVIGDVELGDQASVWFGSVIRADVNHVRIGARTNIQDLSVIHVDYGDHPTVLAEDITVGHRAILHGCRIERGALIGMGAIVMDRVVVGAQSLVAAGSLVSPGTTVPPRSLVVGSPARVTRELNDQELQGLVESSHHYVELGQEYLTTSST